MKILRFELLLLLSGIAAISHGARWWEGDIKKEDPAIKKAVKEAEPTPSATGYEDKKILISLIRECHVKFQTSNTDPATFAKLVALLVRARNSPGIESEPNYKSARMDTERTLAAWDKKIDSLTFIRTLTIYRYKYSYNGATPPMDFIKTVRKHVPKEDEVFQECLAEYMAYHRKEFERSDIIATARNLAKQERGKITKAYVASMPLYYIAYGEKNKALMTEALGYLKTHLSGMQVTDRSKKTQLENNIARTEKLMADWK